MLLIEMSINFDEESPYKTNSMRLNTILENPIEDHKVFEDEMKPIVLSNKEIPQVPFLHHTSSNNFSRQDRASKFGPKQVTK